MNWDRLISIVQADTGRFFGVPDAQVEVLGTERRLYSDLAHVRVVGHPASLEAFVKVTRPKGETEGARRQMAERVQNEFSEAQRIFGALGARPRLGAVRPLSCIPDEFVVITERSPGETLHDLLEREARGWPGAVTMDGLSSALSAVAEWLKTFQAVTPVSGTFSLDGMRDYLDVRLARLVPKPLGGFTEADREDVLAFFDRRRLDVEPRDLRLVAIHADFAPSNVLVHEGRVTTLDFAMTKTGSLFHDLSRLYSQMEFFTAKPIFRRRVISRLQRALLEAFRPGLTAGNPLFELLLMQHTVTHFDTLSNVDRDGLKRLYDVHLRRRHLRWIRQTVRKGLRAQEPASR